MKNVSAEFKTEYWKYHAANHSFEMASSNATMMLEMDEQNPLHYPLLVSMCAFYARPFKHQKSSRNIQSSEIPARFMPVHEHVLRLRDRVYAHHDKNSKFVDSNTGIDMLQLIVLVENGVFRAATTSLVLKKEKIADLKELCEYMRTICHEKAKEMIFDCVDEPIEDGKYMVSTEFGKKGPLLIKDTADERIT